LINLEKNVLKIINFKDQLFVCILKRNTQSENGCQHHKDKIPCRKIFVQIKK